MVPRTIRKQLAKLRRRERGLALLWGAARGFAIALSALAVACLVDWLIDLRRDTPWSLRWTMLGVQILLWCLVAAVFLVRPLFRRLHDSWLALWVEEKAPSLDHRLISAVQLNRGGAQTHGMSPELITAVSREAESQVQQMNFARLADHRRLRWCAVLVFPFLAASALLFLLCPATVKALLARQFLDERDIPRSIYLESVHWDLVWPSGEEVVLRFHVKGEALTDNLRGEVRLQAQGQASEFYPLMAETLASEKEGLFCARVPAPLVDFTYQARLKDGRTRQASSVHLEARPIITQQRAWLVLPSYYGSRPDGKPFEQEQPHGDVVGMPGALVRIAVQAQKPIAEATLDLVGQTSGGAATAPSSAPAREPVLRSIPLKLRPDGARAEGVFPLESAQTAYRIRVRDRYGFENLDPPRRSLQVVTEPLPQVALLPEHFATVGDDGPAEDFEVEGVPVPVGGSIRIAYACSAPAGLGRAQLRYRVNEGSWRPLPLAEAHGSPPAGLFDPRRGTFAKSSAAEQIEFYAVPSSEPESLPGRVEGGGRFDFQTRRLPDLKVGDKIEFYVEAFDRHPDPDRPPGRSEARVKAVVTPAELEAWVRQTLQEESRIRKLEGNQRGVFASAANGDTEETVPQSPNSLDGPVPLRPRLRDAGSTFVRQWQLLGPFPSPDDRGHDIAYAPETEGPVLAKDYEGESGKIRWQLHAGERDKIDLEKFFNHDEAGVAYAACWVRCPDRRQVLLATGSDDGIKVWINRKLVLAKRAHREAITGEDQERVDLGPGWNELLVKIDNKFGSWAFYLELRDLVSGKPPRGLEFQAAPPPGVEQRPALVNSKFVRDWQLLGPFPNPDGNGHTRPFPPETEKIALKKYYDGVGIKIRWRLHHSDQDLIDLGKFFNFRLPCVGYGVCWVRAERKRPVVLSIGSDDGIKIWINKKLAFAHEISRHPVPGQDTMRASLSPGWNELLVKVDNTGGEWGFYLELRDPETNKPLQGVEFRTTPP